MILFCRWGQGSMCHRLQHILVYINSVLKWMQHLEYSLKKVRMCSRFSSHISPYNTERDLPSAYQGLCAEGDHGPLRPAGKSELKIVSESYFTTIHYIFCKEFLSLLLISMLIVCSSSFTSTFCIIPFRITWSQMKIVMEIYFFFFRFKSRDVTLLEGRGDPNHEKWYFAL